VHTTKEVAMCDEERDEPKTELDEA